MHGTTMIFLGRHAGGIRSRKLRPAIADRRARHGFPRLNAFGFWCVPFGGILLHFSVLAGGAPAVGWFSYAPLSETPYSSSPGVDYWAVALFVLGIGSLSFAINTIATVISLRGPGMTMRRLPLFTWINFVNAVHYYSGSASLERASGDDPDRSAAQGHFFLPIGGGSPVLWQHIFWAFGHPEVYILALPAFAIVSEIIPFFRANRFSVTNLSPLRV
jgi:cytochrome c oxidase subunit 1/cytochrome c oxidase subunit I+III